MNSYSLGYVAGRLHRFAGGRMPPREMYADPQSDYNPPYFLGFMDGYESLPRLASIAQANDLIRDRAERMKEGDE